jgi:hypothetical protein
MNKKMIIGGLLLSAIGILLIIKGTIQVQAQCWGHLGCNYYDHVFNYLGYSGIVLVVTGWVVFFEGFLSKKARLLLRLLVGAIGLVIAGGIIWFLSWPTFVG